MAKIGNIIKTIREIKDDKGRRWKLVQEGEYIYLKNRFTYCIGKGKELFSIVADSVCEHWGIRYKDISLDKHFDTENYYVADNIMALAMGDRVGVRYRDWIINASKKDNHIFAKNEYNTRYHRIGHSGNGIVVFYPEAKIVDIHPGVFIKGKEIR